MSSAADTKQPRTFSESVELLRAFAENNATVKAIVTSRSSTPDIRHVPSFMEDMVAAVNSVGDSSRVVNQLSDALASLNIHKMVPMMVNARKANIAMALYAGDGIVAKLTTHQFLNHHLRPHAFAGTTLMLPDVLPPIDSKDVGSFSLEVFPWVDRHGVTNADMAELKERLAKSNLQFLKGDDRLDNIGLLPGFPRRAVVLDSDAVEIIDAQSPNPTLRIPTKRQNDWVDEVHKRFAPLFATEVTNLVSDKPDFTENFSPLIGKTVDWASRPPGPSGKASTTSTRPSFR